MAYNTNTNYRKLITSTKWAKLRAQKIGSDPLCEECLLSDITKPAEEIHHVVPIESAPDSLTMERLCYDYNNLRSLCTECHRKAHIELKSYTKEETKARNKAKTDNFIDKFLS